MIRDVGHEIRVPAVRLPHHAILVVAEVGGPEPQRALGLVRLAGREQSLDRRVHAPVGIERALEEVVVEPHAERGEVAILLAPQLGHREPADRVDVAQVVANLVEIPLRQFADVLAAIAVLRQRRVLAHELLRAHAHRHREILDLLAGVVIVELPRDAGALPFEEPRERVAKRRLAAVADVQRARRVRRNELDHDALAAARFAAPESLAGGEDIRDDCLACACSNEDIDESGACDLDLVHDFGCRQRGHERLRELARILFLRLRELQRDVGREVAVLRLLRPIELDIGGGARSGATAATPCAQQLLQLGAQIAHGAAGL